MKWNQTVFGRGLQVIGIIKQEDTAISRSPLGSWAGKPQAHWTVIPNHSNLGQEASMICSSGMDSEQGTNHSQG